MWPPSVPLQPSVLPAGGAEPPSATWEEARANPARGGRMEPEPGRPQLSPASRLLPQGAAREAPRSVLHNICDIAKPPTEVLTPAAINCSPGLYRRARARAPCPVNCITPARLRWPGWWRRALREQAHGDGTGPRIWATVPFSQSIASPRGQAGQLPLPSLKDPRLTLGAAWGARTELQQVWGLQLPLPHQRWSVWDPKYRHEAGQGKAAPSKHRHYLRAPALPGARQHTSEQ